MQCTSDKQAGVTVVSVRGRLDDTTAEAFEQECSKCIAQGATYLVVDFNGANYISSAGLRSILATAKRLRAAEGKLAVCNLTGMIAEVFTVSGFSTYIPVYGSLGEALGGV